MITAISPVFPTIYLFIAQCCCSSVVLDVFVAFYNGHKQRVINWMAQVISALELLEFLIHTLCNGLAFAGSVFSNPMAIN